MLQHTLPNFSSQRQIHHIGRLDVVGIGEDLFEKRRVFLSRTSSISYRRKSLLGRATFHTPIKKASNPTQKDDLVEVIAKHTSKLEAAAARSIVSFDDEVSAFQWELGAASKRQLQNGIIRAVEGHIFAKAKADLEQVHQFVLIALLWAVAQCHCCRSS